MLVVIWKPNATVWQVKMQEGLSVSKNTFNPLLWMVYKGQVDYQKHP